MSTRVFRGRFAEIGRTIGLDITSCQEEGMNGKSDEEQLAFAADQGRRLVTLDGQDFSDITVRFFERELPHKGLLILTSQVSTQALATVARALVAYERQNPNGMSSYSIDYIRPTFMQEVVRGMS